MSRSHGLVLTVALLLASFTATLRAEVTRFEITRREPFANGQSFGTVGPYERIIGRVYYTLDPALQQNQAIVDLSRAPRNSQGRVEFFADLHLLAPVDLSKGNGALLYEVNNRGNRLASGFFNGGEPGTGFLMRQGFTVVSSGWDGELLPGGDRLRLHAPVATENGKPITGLVRCEMVPGGKSNRLTVTYWENHGSYRPTPAGLKIATLTHRIYPGDTRQSVPRDEFKLHVTEADPQDTAQLPKIELEFPTGLQAGHIYELIYEAQDPLILGVGFAAVRDLVSALRSGTGEGNPLSSPRSKPFLRAHGFGVSQSGRFLREFVYSGFNADEQGRKVFDGVIPHVSGSGLGSFNHRFAQPTRHCNQHDHHEYPGDRFPFAYSTETDPLSGRTDGILKKATESNTAPFILHTQSAGEYWTRSGSLTHTDPVGQRDLKLPDNVRIYLFGGTQHGPAGYPPSTGVGQTPANPGDYKPYLRALLLSLDRWAKEGVPPPASVYPTIAAGTLVDWNQKSTGFPQIPNVRYPEIIQQPSLLDFGPRWETERIADVQPPRIAGRYIVRVPRCGTDGNELGCLSPPEVAVPAGTHTGWNLRHKDFGAENDLVSLGGSYIPFAVTRSEREAAADPRPSLEERYGDLQTYLKQLQTRCAELEADGYLLHEDTLRILGQQEQRLKPMFDKIADAVEK